MSFYYNPIQRWIKKIYRRFNPIPDSPWTKGYVDDICKINLVPSEILKIFFANCIKILQDIKGRDIGDYFEFGVFNGSSLGSAYLAAKKSRLKSIKFFAFDAFKGLPPRTDKESDVLQKGFYCCSFNKTKECLRRRGINPDDITWVKGWYKDTLNYKTIEKLKIKKIGIVFVDCDTYSSSKEALDFLTPLIAEPAIFCFDDWKLYDMDVKGTGEYKAFNEFLEENPHIKAKEIKSYNRKSRSFLIKPDK